MVCTWRGSLLYSETIRLGLGFLGIRLRLQDLGFRVSFWVRVGGVKWQDWTVVFTDTKASAVYLSRTC